MTLWFIPGPWVPMLWARPSRKYLAVVVPFLAIVFDWAETKP
jgi:hypothetical protein